MQRDLHLFTALILLIAFGHVHSVQHRGRRFHQRSCTRFVRVLGTVRRGSKNAIRTLRKDPKLVHFVVACEATLSVAKTDRITCHAVIRGANVILFGVSVLAFLTDNDRWIRKYFYLPSNKRLQRARPLTFLTHAFTHTSLNHILGNLGALAVFAPRVEATIGTRKFTYFYFSSIYASTFLDHRLFGSFEAESAALALRTFLLEEDDKEVSEQETAQYSCGASGAISAIMVFYCLRFSSTKIRLDEDDDPIPAPLAPAIWFLLDFLQLGSGTGVGHGAHLGGFTYGFLTFAVFKLCSIWERGRRGYRRKDWRFFSYS